MDQDEAVRHLRTQIQEISQKISEMAQEIERLRQTIREELHAAKSPAGEESGPFQTKPPT